MMQKRPDETNKGVIFKTFASFTYCISEINNNQISSAKDLDAVMPMYNFIEYSDNSKSIERLWQYYRDERNDNIANSESFRSKLK